MSMSHKAFSFDWKAFESDELFRLLIEALQSNEVSSLIGYIKNYHTELKDPYEGEPLDRNWREMLANHDVYEYGDFALTRFYDPAADLGVAEEWIEVDNLLADPDREAFLGFPIRCANNVFDPGRMGSYFQTPEQVSTSLIIVDKLAIEAVKSFKKLLEDCSQSGSGIYVTF
jgi:hypothetical protein